MVVELAYGVGKLAVSLDGFDPDIIEPIPQTGLPDEYAAVLHALEHPVGTKPLSQWINSDQSVCITFTDITRPTPNERLIPWLLEHLHQHGVRKDQIVLLNQLGTHRPNTKEELERMLTPDVVRSYRVVNHEPENRSKLVQVDVTDDGTPAMMNRHFVESELRIVTGFIEPHLFAGFSGGVKCIMPGVAGLETIMSNHGFRHIEDPLASFGMTGENPVWREMRRIALRAGECFLLNVALNGERQITGVFAGDVLLSHEQGCAFVRESAMRRVNEPYDIVITTNSGYPLDLNLYQTAKGIGAAARIIRPGGTIIVASECREGIPAGSPFDRLLKSANGPSALLGLLQALNKPVADQWQAQIQAKCQLLANVYIYSSMRDEDVRTAYLQPCHDIAATVREVAGRLGRTPRMAVLPYGPITIPFLAQEEYA